MRLDQTAGPLREVGTCGSQLHIPFASPKSPQLVLDLYSTVVQRPLWDKGGTSIAARSVLSAASLIDTAASHSPASDARPSTAKLFLHRQPLVTVRAIQQRPILYQAWRNPS